MNFVASGVIFIEISNLFNTSEMQFFSEIILFIYISCILLSILFILSYQDLKYPLSEKCASIIIPFRNEDQNLESLLESLLKQDYLLEKCQFIFVNDRSEDQSEAIIDKYISKFFDAELIFIYDLPQGKFAKKYALEKGIDRAKYDILLFTDADCICEKNWISSTVSSFGSETDCVIGKAALTHTKGFISYFQEAENFFNHIILVITARINKATVAFGRNFAYRKSSFLKIKGFSKIEKSVSGDDDLLLREFQRSGMQIRFNNESCSYSKTVVSFSEFIRQKTRHFHTVKYIPIKDQFFPIFIHFIHFLFMLSLIYYGFYFLFFYKFIADFSLYYFTDEKLCFRSPLRNVIYWELFYWLFVPLFGARMFFIKQSKINWKK